LKIKVLLIGGYGNFGRHIAKQLSQEKNIELIIAGRNLSKAEEFAKSLNAINIAKAVKLDINNNILEPLSQINPNLVIHTSGPYQGQSYKVAQSCIKQKCHYVDLADARKFVNEITSLDSEAKKAGVLICSGASSVPCLTSAIIDKYINEFENLEEIEYGIATAQLTNRGLATTEAVLSYAGKPFKTLIKGEMQYVYGWLDLSFRKFWNLNNRPLGNCDIPDLELFPKRYPTLKTIRFKAGLEFKFLHIILFFLSWLVKVGLIKSLQSWAKRLLKISFLFDFIGKDDSGFYMLMKGKDKKCQKKEIMFEIFAKNGDGLYIPSTPAIIMAKKFANNEIDEIGAKPCVDIINLDEYLENLGKLNITWRVEKSE
jgi:saccharopine dehydrogenase-like NADP-dependent oxidoreductase